jgi:D-amino peptidase
MGDSVVALVHPETGRKQIRAGVQNALESDLSTHTLPHADHFTLKVRWVHHAHAYKYSFYPGATLEDSQTTVFESSSYWDVITFLTFIESG